MIFKNKKKKTSEEKFKKTSYSQSGEDLIIKYIFDCLGIAKPSYIDIGAHHPFYFNNTAIFYKNGSTGINIEPDSALIAKFHSERPNDVNLNIAIGETNDTAKFYILNVPTLNTFSKKTAESYKKQGNFFIKNEVDVKTKILKTVIDEHCNGIFPDFLSLDAEEMDKKIIEQLFNYNYKPTLICVETISFSMKGNGEKDVNLIVKIEKNGYMNYADTNINTIFVRKDKWINK
jgi:FkbM family methyltransferase